MLFIHYKVVLSYSIFYRQIEKNMAKTLNFVCALILFISFFLVSKNVASKTFYPLLRFSSLIFGFYIFYLLLVTSFYPLSSLQ